MRSVRYLISGAAHLPYLIVSLYTLRKHWWGDVEIHAWPESVDRVREICKDNRLGVRCTVAEPYYRGKNSQFLHKIKVMQQGEADDTLLYLDADTMVCGEITELFHLAEAGSFCATQFNLWSSNIGSPYRRIGNLLGNQSIDQASVRLAMTEPMPSVNGGVFACRPTSPVLKLWQEWTESALDIFIADETVLHAVQAFYWSAEPSDYQVAKGGAFNCSPKYKPRDLPDHEVRIWHFHGDCNTRLQKCPRGVELWYPVYQQCVRENLGSIVDWLPTVGNRHLTELENHYDSLKGRSVEAAAQ